MPAKGLTLQSDYKGASLAEENNGVFGPGRLGTEMCPRDGAQRETRLRENTMRLVL